MMRATCRVIASTNARTATTVGTTKTRWSTVDRVRALDTKLSSNFRSIEVIDCEPTTPEGEFKAGLDYKEMGDKARASSYFSAVCRNSKASDTLKCFSSKQLHEMGFRVENGSKK